MYTTFEAGGEQYRLQYTVNALCEFEKKYDKGVIEALDDSKTFYYLRGLIWAGLITQQHGITIDKTGEIIGKYFEEGHELRDMIGLLTEALRGAGFFHKNGSETKQGAATAKSKK